MQGFGDYRTPVLSSFIELVGKLVFTFVFVRLFGYWGIIWTEPVIWFLMVIPLIIMTLKNPVIRKDSGVAMSGDNLFAGRLNSEKR